MSVEGMVTIGGFIVVIAGGIFRFGQIKHKLDTACERQKEDRADNARKFQELYESRNHADVTMGKFATMIEQIYESLRDINGKIDKALEK